MVGLQAVCVPAARSLIEHAERIVKPLVSVTVPPTTCWTLTSQAPSSASAGRSKLQVSDVALATETLVASIRGAPLESQTTLVTSESCWKTVPDPVI